MMSGSADQYAAAREALIVATDDRGTPWASSLTDEDIQWNEIGRGSFGIVSELKSRSGRNDIGGRQVCTLRVG